MPAQNSPTMQETSERIFFCSMICPQASAMTLTLTWGCALEWGTSHHSGNKTVVTGPIPTAFGGSMARKVAERNTRYG
jgi:hypothetical protein